MRRNSALHDPWRAAVIAQFNYPRASRTLELVYSERVKCGAIVKKSAQERGKCGLVLKANLNINPVFGRILWYEINRSEIFGAHLAAWLFDQWQRMDKNTQCNSQEPSTIVTHIAEFGEMGCLVLNGCRKQNMDFPICRIYTHINLQPPSSLCILLEPDLRWSKKLLPHLIEYIQLQDVMAWLSTLGGAYSSMGDHLNSHSEKAGQISQHQLLVAMRMGDPILAAQCKVFAAMSLIQRGQLKVASRIIRKQYSLATMNDYGNDTKLISSCKAAWCRIQYLKQQRKANKEREQELYSKTKDTPKKNAVIYLQSTYM